MNLRNTMISLAVFLFLLSAGVAPASAQGLYDRNLVANGDAEAAPTAQEKVPGWTTYGPFTVVAYDADGAMGPEGHPVERLRGKNYFSGGPGTARSYAEQYIPLASLEAGAKFYFSAFLGRNYGNNPVKVISLTATFVKDRSDRANPIQVVTLQGPDDDTEWDIPGGLVPRATSGVLLGNIVGVWITLNFATPTEGSSANGYAADSLSLRLTREPLIGANLVVNGDAELEPFQEKPVNGWNSEYHSFWVKKYEPEFSNYDPGLLNPGPADRGQYFLRIQASDRRAWQIIDVASDRYNPLIDAGRINYEFRAWLGIWQGEPDELRGRATFLDKTGASVGTVDIGPVTGGTQQEFLLRTSDLRPLPAGTRRVKIELIVNRKSIGVNDASGWADNVSFILTTADVGVTLVSVANAASGATGMQIAPGEMVTLKVSGLDLQGWTGMQLEGKNTSVSRSLAGVSVTFDNVAAPLLYVSAAEIGAIVPFEVQGRGKIPVQVAYKSDKSAAATYDVVPAVPGVFTQEAPASGNTAGLIWNNAWTLNSAGNPAAKGSLVTVFWTGGGQTDPGGVTGRIELQGMARLALPVAVTVAGRKADVVYAGAVPNSWAGLLMAQFRVPDVAEISGQAAVVITVTDPARGDLSSPAGAATMWVQR